MAYFRSAADRGHTFAQCDLGYCYFNGIGVEPDPAAAFNYYTLAAAQGNARALCNLGYCYETGKGAANDPAEAARYYKQAAEKGSVQAQHVPFDLSHTVLSVALPFESAIFEAGKQLNTEVPDGIAYTGDPEMIKQLCVILLSNAQKYSDAHGVITLSLEARGDRRILKVHNTGPAIPEEAQQKIFDRFYRVDSSHNREIEGNGLGLAIAQSIVKEHKGKIAVASREGEGTTFTVVL